MRTLEVDWKQEHTTIVIVNPDGTFEFGESSTPGIELVRVIDPEGGPDIDEIALALWIAREGS